MSASPPSIGPLSARRRLRKVDGRTQEGKFLRATERALIEHLGGPDKITAPQRFLIERIATNLLRLELYDQKVADGHELTDLDGRIMHALEGAVRRGLHELGLHGFNAHKQKPQTALEYLKAKERVAS